MRFFSLAVALLAAVPCFLQTEHATAAEHLPVLSTLRAVPVEGGLSLRRTKSSGTYYKRPEGAYYVGFGFSGKGYYPSVLYVRPWQAVTFVNTDFEKRGEWHTWTFSKTTNTGEYFSDPSVVVDASGDYRMSYTPGEQYYTPTLTLGADSFFIGEENYFHVLKTGNSFHPGRVMAGGKVLVKAVDDHQRFFYMGNTYSNLQRWGIVGDNVYGTGNYGKYPSYGAVQVFDRPMAPLTVERVFLQGCSYARQPIPEGDTLVCYVSKCKEQQLSNGKVVKVPTREYTDTLFALASDTLGFVSEVMRNGRVIYDGYVFFSKRVDNEETPVVINPADFDENGFALVVEGFDREGVDLGVYGYYFNDDVDDLQEGQVLFRDPDSGRTGFDIYGSGLAMAIGMESLYDAIVVTNVGGANVMYVSADGQTCAVRGDTSQGIVVKTAQEWQDADGASNYQLIGLPEWVDEVRIDESLRSADDHRGECVLSFVCQPLPEGTDSRMASVFVKGSGVESRTPLRIIQDRVTLGIERVVSPSHATQRSYHINGQPAGAHARGIIIREGRKRVVR